MVEQSSTATVDGTAVEDRTTDEPCIECVLSRSLDDDEPKQGTVRWAVRRTGRLAIGMPISFVCPHGHSSDGDPALLKAFRLRRF